MGCSDGMGLEANRDQGGLSPQLFYLLFRAEEFLLSLLRDMAVIEHGEWRKTYDTDGKIKRTGVCPISSG